MDIQQRARRVESMLHQAHVQWQRDELRKQRDADASKLLPSPVIRGEMRVSSKSERAAQARRAEYWTMADAAHRPNYLKAYLETVAYMAKHLKP